jgi:hypothetical protein
VLAAIYEVEPLGAFSIVDVKVGEQILKAQLPGQPKFLKGEPYISASISISAICSMVVPKGGWRPDWLL